MATILEYKTKLDNSSFQKGMKENLSTTSSLDKGMSTLGKSIGAAFAIGSVVAFGKSIVDSLVKYEYFHSSLKTLLYGNINATNALEQQLISLAKTTPFSLEDVQEGTKKLLAYGFQAGSITDELKKLGDISAGVGAPLNDIVYLYGTLKTSGIAYTKDINQFTGRGIPIVKELSKQFGVAEDKIKKMAETGKISFKDIESAFKNMTSEGGQFFNMMAEQSKTVGGQISNMSDDWEQAKIEIGKSQRGIIASSTAFFSDLISSFKEYWQAKNFEEGKTQTISGNRNEGLEKVLEYDSAFKNAEELRGGALASGYSEKIRKLISEEKDINTLTNFIKSEQRRIKSEYEGGLGLQPGSSSYTTRMTAKLMANELATLGQAAKYLQGLKGLKTTPITDAKAKADKDKPSKEAQARENITINIDSIGKQMTINSIGVKESTEEIKAIILDSLQSAVFGAKYAGR